MSFHQNIAKSYILFCLGHPELCYCLSPQKNKLLEGTLQAAQLSHARDGGTRAVIRTVNYSNITIIKLTVTVRIILILFEEFHVDFNTFFDAF
jgi:hypothetical protein